MELVSSERAVRMIVVRMYPWRLRDCHLSHRIVITMSVSPAMTAQLLCFPVCSKLDYTHTKLPPQMYATCLFAINIPPHSEPLTHKINSPPYPTHTFHSATHSPSRGPPLPPSRPRLIPTFSPSEHIIQASIRTRQFIQTPFPGERKTVEVRPVESSPNA